ncbi:hypothetical protein ACUY28_02285 [Corynebacterium sanguinis]|uniref:Uncharacterized protein n=1 Tax=Corynebacterium sanguinis TaxID=2594913 RepID=A0A838X568_9CORY|nr:hypothetical protein [Corynebacterium sanguinis]MBA4506201.1 hypothetical protein [Corynebacterium sanguinis]MCT1583921.1 hypothetical protein [Corynebacterium sanguinis]MCT1663272.1 hypothetical protein [Corynebacterium sanguinis]MCT2046381.1 hypothetical protein [Corynebacterium sanguinis]MDN8577399.1 hypothetical protein [Corynebacterium sanguinis]
MYEDILESLQRASITLPGTQPVVIKYHPDNRNTVDNDNTFKELASHGHLASGYPQR